MNLHPLLNNGVTSKGLDNCWPLSSNRIWITGKQLVTVCCHFSPHTEVQCFCSIVQVPTCTCTHHLLSTQEYKDRTQNSLDPTHYTQNTAGYVFQRYFLFFRDDKDLQTNLEDSLDVLLPSMGLRVTAAELVPFPSSLRCTEDNSKLYLGLSGISIFTFGAQL